MIFVPKGEEDSDESFLSRSPLDTRPLSLKGCDNKTIGAVVNAKLRVPLAKQLSDIQRGFVHGRQLIQNVVDLDSAARLTSMTHDCGALPLMVFFDFAAAFPSVLHEWIQMIMQAYGLPDGLASLVDVFYACNFSYTKVQSDLVFLFILKTGVHQGCPLSGWIFAIIFDPFVRLFQQLIDYQDRGMVRVCADDVGAVVDGNASLNILFDILDLARRYAGLCLKEKKCIIVPIGGKFSLQAVENIRDWLCRSLPQWSRFEIQAAARYLGFWLGTAVADAQWSVQTRKWRSRSKAIALVGASAHVTAMLYNQRALPVLGYVSQLVPLPANIASLERNLLCSLMHIPANTFDTPSAFLLHTVGGPRFRSCAVFALSSLLRAALVTVVGWKVQLHSLQAAANVHLPFLRVAQRLWWPEFWDSPPFVVNLHNAIGGLVFPPSALPALPDIRALMPVKRPQAVIYFKIFPLMFPEAKLFELVRRRLRNLVPEYRAQIDAIDWQLVARRLKAAGSHSAMCVLKTWLNAWNTSTRFHDAIVLPCVFGCRDCEDCTAHYIRCPVLWGLASSSTAVPILHPYIYNIFLLHYDSTCIRNLVVVFATYHTTRKSFHDLAVNAAASGDFSVISRKACALAKAAARKFSC